MRLFCFTAAITVVASLPVTDDGLSSAPDLFLEESSLFDDSSAAPLSLNDASVGQGLVGDNNNNNDLFLNPPLPTENTAIGSSNEAASEDLAAAIACRSGIIDSSDNQQQQQPISKRQNNKNNENVCTDPSFPSKGSSAAPGPLNIDKILNLFGTSSGQGGLTGTDTERNDIPPCPFTKYPVHLCCQVEGPLDRDSYYVHEYYWFCRFGTFFRVRSLNPFFFLFLFLSFPLFSPFPLFSLFDV